MRSILAFIALVSWLALSACSTVSGPEPVDISRIDIGTSRQDVERLLGAPISLVQDKEGTTYVYRFNRGCIGEANINDNRAIGVPILIVAPVGPVLIFYHVGNVFIPVPSNTLGARADIDEILELTIEITYDQEELVSDVGDLPKSIPPCKAVWQAAKNLKVLKQVDRNVRKRYAENLRKHGPLACTGDKRSQYLIGQYFRDGHGVTRDYAQSYKWFSLASRDGDAAISAFRDELATRMTPGQIALGERLAAEWRPYASTCEAQIVRSQT